MRTKSMPIDGNRIEIPTPSASTSANRLRVSYELAEQPMRATSTYRVIADHLTKMPGAAKDGTSIFGLHSLRATTAMLLLNAGVDIRMLRELRGHHYVTTTRRCDKRRRTCLKGAE